MFGLCKKNKISFAKNPSALTQNKKGHLFQTACQLSEILTFYLLSQLQVVKNIISQKKSLY
jgi:hypothetical protein